MGFSWSVIGVIREHYSLVDLARIIGGGFGFGSLRTVGISQCQCQLSMIRVAVKTRKWEETQENNDSLTSSPIEVSLAG